MGSETTLNWDQFTADIVALAAKIRASEFRPHLIVAIARGGWIPARYLSSLLGVKELASIGLRYKTAERTELELYSFPEPIGSENRLLLVEDMLESAKSMVKAKELLDQKGAVVRTASLYVSPNSILQPDFSLGLRTRVRFPWEK